MTRLNAAPETTSTGEVGAGYMPPAPPWDTPTEPAALMLPARSARTVSSTAPNSAEQRPSKPAKLREPSASGMRDSASTVRTADRIKSERPPSPLAASAP